MQKHNLIPARETQVQPTHVVKHNAIQRGNEAFRAGNYEKAVEEFTVALLHDSGDHCIYSNRSAAYAQLQQYNLALQDAQQSTTICPAFSKGWGCVAAANHGLGNYPGAVKAYSKALEVGP